MANYDDAINYINTIPQFIAGYGIDRGRELLEKLDHPEHSFMVIHVAGTNGKGSVSAYIESILRNAGYKTGLFTSPHLVEERERIRINGKRIDKEQFGREYNKVRSTDINLAYFDYFFGIAMCAFKDANVDICVIETGLGGLLDITNAVENPIGCVITSISLDHCAILGDTVEKIAEQKAGIIKKGVTVVFESSDEGVTKIVESIANDRGSRSVGVDCKHAIINKTSANCIDFLINNEYYKNDMFTIATRALYQVDNATLALCFISVMEQEGKIHVSHDSKVNGLKSAQWPGRMENVCQNVYVDGAHNPDGVNEFLASVRNISRGEKSILLFSAVNDKNFKGMIKEICGSGLFSEYVVLELHTSRGLPAAQIKDTFEEITDSSVNIYDNLEEALQYGRSREKLLFCAGSLYLVGEIKQIISNGGLS